MCITRIHRFALVRVLFSRPPCGIMRPSTRGLALFGYFVLYISPAMCFITSQPIISPARQSTTSLRARLMDNIILQKRIEEMDSMVVGRVINGLNFVHYNDSSEEKRATVLFLPGLDGSGCTLGPQVEDLVKSCNLWSLSCPADDRSSFSTLTNAVVTHLKAQGTDTPTVIVGESFGGLLALAVALSLGQEAKTYIKSLLLVNPATSFASTPWQLIIPLFRDLPERFYPLAVTPALVAVGPDITQFRRVLGRIIQPLRPPWEQAQVATETVTELLDLIAFLTRQIPLDTLQWRITRWLQAGSYRVMDRLEEIDLPVVVAAGTQDRVLPSVSEARRLQARLPDCSIITIQGSGHISLDERVNMTDILLKSPRLLASVVRGRPFDPVKDYIRPSPAVQERYKGIVERAIERFTSPVFFSTAADGTIVEGLQAAPDHQDGRKPILFVGNHQLIGLDLGVIIKRFMEEKDMLVRGLAHPALFRERKGGGDEREIIFTEDQALFSSGFKTSTGGDTTGLRNVFQTWGAVPVSARNFYSLLGNGEAVLLFPGGARETYHKKGEEYQVFWPEKSEFVRMCASLNATIVPFSAIGCADSFRMVLDSQDLLSLPVIGERVRQLSDNIPNARGDVFPEDFIAPVLAPAAPARFYFLFGKPLETTNINGRNRDEASEVYATIRKEVELGIKTLLQVREQDPYKEFLPRVTYESVRRTRAPTIDARDVQLVRDGLRQSIVSSEDGRLQRTSMRVN